MYSRELLGVADKEQKYPEFTGSARCELVVLAIDAGGRFSVETMDFIKELALAKASSAPAYLRAAVAKASQRRCTRMLAVTAASAYAASLVGDLESFKNEPAFGGGSPWLQSMLSEARHESELRPPAS